MDVDWDNNIYAGWDNALFLAEQGWPSSNFSLVFQYIETSLDTFLSTRIDRVLNMRIINMPIKHGNAHYR